jgi:EAL and modified HD-GYP domain-containing signal transduction protein
MNDIEPIIKQDLALSYRLMRYINSSMFGLRSEIQSVRHAMLLMGERDIRRWATLATLSSLSNDKPAELLEVGLIRARFCENLVPLLGRHAENGDELFLLGLFSVLDACLDVPMAEALKDLAVPARVKGALCGVPGTMHDILNLVMAFERGDWEFVDEHGKNLGLAALAAAYVASIDWARAACVVERESRHPAAPLALPNQ